MGYLAWAWNAVTQTITITQDGVEGISWATAYDFLDIALGIAANGWVGVPWTEQCEQKHFCSGIKFMLSAGTYFWDMEKQITLLSTTPAFAGGSPWWYILGNSGFRLGYLDNVANKVTSRGCHVLNNNTGGPIFRWQASGTRELLSCAFTNINDSSLIGYCVAGRLWNCIANNQALFNSSTDIYNTITTDGLYGLQYITGVMDRLTVQNKTYGAYALAGLAFQASNTIFRNNTYTLLAGAINTNKILINCDADAWTLRWGVALSTAVWIRRYEFDLTVVDRVTGAPIVGANVILYDQFGAVVFNVFTGAGGAIATQTVTYETYADAGGVYPHSNTTTVAYHPFTLVVTYPTYHTYIDTAVELDAKTDWEIALCRAPDLVFVDDRVALNLDAENPESELFTHL